MLGWGTSLRIARRTARRSLGRTVLIAALIGLPVMAASWIAVMTTTTAPSGETFARQQIGTADANLTVTTMPRITVESFLSGPTTVSYGDAQQSAHASLDPRRVDPAVMLPAGSKVVPALETWSASATLRTADAIGNYPVQGVTASNPLTKGTFRLDEGRMPSSPREVALSPKLAGHLGLLANGKLIDGATVRTADGHEYAAVGLARKPDRPEQPMLWALPRTPLVPTPQNADLSYLVDLPSGSDTASLQHSLAGHGIALTPRAWIVDPPSQPYSTNAASMAAVVLVIGFGVLEIVLLAGTAFAVGARRQTRELGLVTATGGTPGDVRKIVLAQGLFLGLVGTGTAAAVAIAAAVLARPVWERLFDHLIDGYAFPPVPLLVIAGIGILSGLAAAVVPAITAGRQAPMAALSGRFTAAKGNGRLRRPALALVALGVGSVLVGTARLGAAFAESRRAAAENPQAYHGGVTPTTPIALVLIGITAVIAGLVWLLPNLVARAAALGRALPLSGRLALRDAARHRHRTGPATAAIMMSVGGTVAMAFALSNSAAAEKVNYVPWAPDGYAVVRYDDGAGVPGQPRTAGYSSALVEQLSRRLPASAHFDLGAVERRDVKPVSAQGAGGSFTPRMAVTAPDDCRTHAEACASTYLSIVVVDPAYLDKLGGFGPAVADVLRSGRIAVPRDGEQLAGSSAIVRGGRAQVTGDDMTGQAKPLYRPATLVDHLPRFSPFGSVALVSPEMAAQLGRLKVTETHFELTRDPTGDELKSAIALLGDENAIQIEHGFDSHAGIALIALLSAATVVTLLGVAIAVALSAAEGRADLATLAAVGAPPRRRRSLAAAQAWLLGQLGCLLGVFIGGLYGYTAHVAFGSPSFAIPWAELGGILVVVPVFAGLLAWLLTRSRLPMVRRVE